MHAVRFSGRCGQCRRSWRAAVQGVALLCATLHWATLPAFSTPLQLELPVTCTVPGGCLVQNYVDVDPGPAARDFLCRGATYDGHKGTDFRVSSAGPDKTTVRAVAAGVVRGVRDGMVSQLVTSAQARRSVAGKECGNGVVIQHAGGWESQYCHLAPGVQVRTGDEVRQGAVLGQMGASGLAQFIHLHLSLRKNGAVIDPFTGAAPSASACRPRPTSAPASSGAMWTSDAAAQLPGPRTRLLGAGFLGAPPSLIGLERGTDQRQAATATAGALVYYARVMHAQEGDRVVLELESPNRPPMTSVGDPIDRFKATFFRFIGRRRPPGGWPRGVFRARLSIKRGGQTVLRAQDSITLR